MILLNGARLKAASLPHCLLLVFCIFVCVTTSSAFAEPTKKFRVGAILPLTGGLAEYGVAARNGFELAKEHHPELFTNIAFDYEDSQWDAKTALSAFNRLRHEGDVSLVFNWGNPTTEAIAPVAETSHMPLIGMSLDPGSARGKKYLIRCINPASDFSKRLAEYLRQREYRRLGVVIAQNTYVQGLLDGLNANLGSDRKVSTIASYTLAETDFRTSIAKIKSSNFDAIGVFLISGQVSSFYRQLRDQKVALPTFGTDFFESTSEIKMAGAAMEAAVYPHLGVDKSFASRYVGKHGNDYQIAYAGNAYDIAVMIGTLFNNAARLSADQIMDELRSSKTSLNGVTGPFKYRHTRDGDSYYEFPVQLKRIENGRYVVLNDS